MKKKAPVFSVNGVCRTNKNKLYEATVEATEKVKVRLTIEATSVEEAIKKLAGKNRYTNTEDEVSRIELMPWKLLTKPKEIKD